MDHCLRHMPPLSDPMPGIGDHLYILPKLLLFRGSHPNPTYNQKVMATPPLREDKWGRFGDSYAPLPPLGITSEVWMQARHKLCPLGDDRPALPMFATPGDWHPTPGEIKKALTRLKPGKALDLGGWSSEILQNAFKTPNLRDLGTSVVSADSG